MDHYRSALERQGDALFQDRLADIRDVVMRLTSHLSDALHEDSGSFRDR